MLAFMSLIGHTSRSIYCLHFTTSSKLMKNPKFGSSFITISSQTWSYVYIRTNHRSWWRCSCCCITNTFCFTSEIIRCLRKICIGGKKILRLLSIIDKTSSIGWIGFAVVLCDNNDKLIIAKARPLLNNDNALYIISIIMLLIVHAHRIIQDGDQR